jgi:putative salt-induced outer membrane protein YdiY
MRFPTRKSFLAKKEVSRMHSTARRTLEYPVFHFWLTLALLLLATPAGADEIIMRDGSRLLGSVVKGEGETVAFKTSFAGVINIKWEEIAEINSEKPMEFLLSDDTIVSGTHVTNNVDQLVVEGAFGQPSQSIGQAEVAVINPESWRKGDGYKVSGRVNFAFSRQRGNTDKEEADVDGDLTWRRKNDRFTAFGELQRDRNDNKTTTDKWRLEGAYNYFVTKQWYWGGFGRLEHDKFADLDLRTSVGPLVGYQWFESKKMNLSTSTGISYVRENFISQSDDDYAALPWSIKFDRFLFGDFMQFYHKQTGFWNLENTNDVVWDTWTGLRFPLVLGLVASTEIQVEYDSGAAKGADSTDTTYSLKLGYQW